MNESIKNIIIKKGIIRKEDWDKASLEHIQFAETLLLLSEQIGGDAEFSEEEQVIFLEETQEINDLSELKNVDKVEPNKSFESETIQIGIPIQLVPLIRQIYKEMKNG
jgi:hypothetical protein